MLSTFFKAKPVIDEESKEWIFDTFAWCMDQLDGDFFKNNSELILPNNNFYPGSASSIEAMADKIFSNTLNYTGMTSWPLKLISADNFTQKPMPQLSFESRLRGENAKVSTKVASNISSTISYKVEGEAVVSSIPPSAPTIDLSLIHI